MVGKKLTGQTETEPQGQIFKLPGSSAVPIAGIVADDQNSDIVVSENRQLVFCDHADLYLQILVQPLKDC